MVSIFQSVNNITEGRSVEVQRKYSRDKTRALTSEEEERLLGDSLVAPVQASVHTLSSNRDTLTSTSGQGNTLNSVKSVRNYKRTQQRPASTLNGDPLGAKRAGLCESEPHVYKVRGDDVNPGVYVYLYDLFRRARAPISVGSISSIGPSDAITCPDVSRSHAPEPEMEPATCPVPAIIIFTVRRATSTSPPAATPR